MKLAINAMMTRPGGALSVLVGLLKAWRALGCPIDVSILAGISGTVQTLQEALPGAEIVPIELGHSALRRTLWQATRLRRWLIDRQVDVLLTNNHYLPGMPCPQVVHHHNLWRFVTADLGVARSRRPADLARDYAARRALRHAAANVFVSDFLRRKAESFVPSSSPRNHVIPNCVDEGLFERGAASAAAQFHPNRLVAVQNANPHKDNPTLVRTLAALVEAAPNVDWRLLVAGSSGRGDWLPYRQLASELGVAERIDWLGFLSHNVLEQIERESLCLILTTRFESSGLTLIEAMAAGCPVVASRIGAFEEYAAGAAVLIEPGQPRRFAEAVLSLHQDAERRRQCIDAGRTAAGGYRWSIWAPRFAQIITQAAGRGQTEEN
jgi:glycosyltransferase involved in cell wall biosynthesis